MIHILESFACGIAFAVGFNCYYYLRDLATAKGREELRREALEHSKRIEERLGIQIEALVAVLEEVKKNGGSK